MARLTARINLLERIYGGHQFGHWAEQFGDGRAIMLSETKRSTRWAGAGSFISRTWPDTVFAQRRRRDGALNYLIRINVLRLRTSGLIFTLKRR